MCTRAAAAVAVNKEVADVVLTNHRCHDHVLVTLRYVTVAHTALHRACMFMFTSFCVVDVSNLVD